MSEWAPRRFWRSAAPAPAEGGHEVHLDGRPVTTPGQARLRLPTHALAAAVASEWNAVEGRIDPAAMALTRLANTALDRIAPARADVIAELRGYGAHDLLCYRAEGPEALRARQGAAWDPLLGWAERRFAARLTVTTGVMPADQPQASLDALSAAVAARDDFALTALGDLVTLSGSLIIGLAALEDAADAEALWARSRIDETWQEERWGRDSEAAAQAARHRDAFLTAWRMARLLDLSPDPDGGPPPAQVQA